MKDPTVVGLVSVRSLFGNDGAQLPEPFKKGEAHLRIARVSPQCWCVSAVGGEGSLPLPGHLPFLPKSQGTSLLKMAIFHLSIRPISRAKGHNAVAQIAYDTRSKLNNERTGETLDWSKHKQDVIQWQIIGPNLQPGELAARAERAEKRWDARVGRTMDVALPNELSTKAQWDLLRGFGLQLHDTFGAALCVSLHPPNTKGDHRNVHGHIFMTSRAVDDEGNFSKTKDSQSR